MRFDLLSESILFMLIIIRKKGAFKLEKKIRYYNANLIIYVDMNKSNKMPEVFNIPHWIC